MKTHTAKTTAEIRKPDRHTRATRIPFIRLRGQWLKQYGFSEGVTAYITETPEGLLISPKPPTQKG
jgi:hypothetical protein